MSIATGTLGGETRIRFAGVGFDVYESLIRATPPQTAVRMAFDGKDLEIAAFWKSRLVVGGMSQLPTGPRSFSNYCPKLGPRGQQHYQAPPRLLDAAVRIPTLDW